MLWSITTKQELSVEDALDHLLDTVHSCDVVDIAPDDVTVGAYHQHSFDDMYQTCRLRSQIEWTDSETGWSYEIVLSQSPQGADINAMMIVITPPFAWSSDVKADTYSAAITIAGHVDNEGFSKAFNLANKERKSVREGMFPLPVKLDIFQFKTVMLHYRGDNAVPFKVQLRFYRDDDRPRNRLGRAPSEVRGEILSHLGIDTISSFSNTNRHNRFTKTRLAYPLDHVAPGESPTVSVTLTENLYRRFRPYFGDVGLLRAVMAVCGAWFVGGQVAGALLNARWDGGDLDLMVDASDAEQLYEFLKGEHYMFDDSKPLDGYPGSGIDVHHFHSWERDTDIDVITVPHDSSKEIILQGFHSTIVQNYATSTAVYVWYPTLTNRNLTEFNYVPEYGVPDVVRTVIDKYCIARGVRFEGLIPPPINTGAKKVVCYGW